jgi:hypothetical protein
LHGAGLTSNEPHCSGYDWYGGADPEWVWAGEAKPGGPAAPVITSDDPVSRPAAFETIREHIALAVSELDRIAAHHYQTPLDPPLRLPAPVQRTVSLCERFRTALMLIECHELRDHEDYEAIKEIAAEALRGRKS